VAVDAAEIDMQVVDRALQQPQLLAQGPDEGGPDAAQEATEEAGALAHGWLLLDQPLPVPLPTATVASTASPTSSQSRGASWGWSGRLRADSASRSATGKLPR